MVRNTCQAGAKLKDLCVRRMEVPSQWLVSYQVNDGTSCATGMARMPTGREPIVLKIQLPRWHLAALL
jgi:hypothetical protein